MPTKGSGSRAIKSFLDAFNTIDAKLRKMTRTDRHVPFTAVLRLAREKDPSLSAVADRIELFNQLRNVIVHNGTNQLRTPAQRCGNRKCRRAVAGVWQQSQSKPQRRV